MTVVKDKPEDQLALIDHQQYLLVKQIIDLTICLLSLPVVLPIMACIALAVVVDSRGAPIFVQDRVGKDGRVFRMYKFRTLQKDYHDLDDRAFMQAFVAGKTVPHESRARQAYYKPPIENKLTRVGRILRKLSLDELPQIFNVLQGEMSLVGPRPNVTWEVEKYHDWHYQRLKVLPGITGLAQVRGRSSITFDGIVQHDLEYIQNQCLKLDLQILWWTVLAVLHRNGAG